MCEKIDIKLELEYSKARIQDELVENIKDANIDISRTGRDKELIELISDVWFEHLSSYIELYPEYFEKKIINSLIEFLEYNYRTSDEDLNDLTKGYQPVMFHVVGVRLIGGDNEDKILNRSLELTKRRLKNKYSMKKRELRAKHWIPISISVVAMVISLVSLIIKFTGTPDNHQQIKETPIVHS